MILRLPKNLVRKGLYIEAVECPSHEFARRRFMVETQEDLNAIRMSSAVDILVSQKKSQIDVLALLKQAPPQYHRQANPADPQMLEIKGALSDAVLSMHRGMSEAAAGRLDMSQIADAAASARQAVEAAPDLFVQVTRLKAKDKASYMHSISVAGLMTEMAARLELDDDLIDEIGRAGILHDLGKLLIPNAILNKPGKLNAAEMRMMRSHPEIGYRHMKKLGGVSDLILDVCRLHHEALDGSGYPLGLKDEQIGIAVRICTVCDVFDALTSVRSYKGAWSASDALTWMYDRPNLFDRKLVLRLSSMLN
ncbi:HD domain-containing phosphohydrolase [Neorhizobium sp. NCHU2750]|uniref:HD domain-containing phosphohydrolase n=1 Tax=Neorhizobium sp. NCHU2750 TaxID=1825976 RepID=UPI000EB6C020|nr:phosphohydrolase [Neorhizobium sp. NCHU2750]